MKAQHVLLSGRHIMKEKKTSKETVQCVLERYCELSAIYYWIVKDHICGGVLIHLVIPVFLESALFSYLFLRN